MQAMLPAVVCQQEHAASSKAHASLGLQWVDGVVAEEGLSKQSGDISHWSPGHEAAQSPHLLMEAGSMCWQQDVVRLYTYWRLLKSLTLTMKIMWTGIKGRLFGI